jgi:hypothetical protein
MATCSDPTAELASAVSDNLSLTDNDLSDLIKIQGDIVRKLKAEKVSKEKVCVFQLFVDKTILFD